LAVEVKSNEVTVIPKLLGLLQLTDATMMIDAMGRQQGHCLPSC